jgi:hypothetical protein
MHKQVLSYGVGLLYVLMFALLAWNQYWIGGGLMLFALVTANRFLTKSAHRLTLALTIGLVTGIIAYKLPYLYREGMTNGSSSAGTNEGTGTGTVEGRRSTGTATSGTSTTEGTATTEEDTDPNETVRQKIAAKLQAQQGTGSGSTTAPQLGAKDAGQKKQGFTGINVPKKNKQSRIDYASTVSKAYGQFDKVLGTEGIQQLSADTRDLMRQQKELFNTMQTMAPTIMEAQHLLGPLLNQLTGKVA